MKLRRLQLNRFYYCNGGGLSTNPPRTNSQSQLIRFYSFCPRQPSIRILVCSENNLGGNSGLTEAIMPSSSISFLARQGSRPVIISQRISPRLQIQVLELQCYFLRSCGLMQNGVPTRDLLRSFSYIFLANPKSVSLQVPSLSSTFAGFRSLWTRLFQWRYLMPERSCLKIFKASTQAKGCLRMS